jgi:CBS domain-containing protein
MAIDNAGGTDLLGTIERTIIVIRDGLLAGLIVVAIIALWSLWPKFRQQLETSSIESVSLGALSIKLGVEQVSSFQSGRVPIEAVGGSADILEKGSLQDLAQAQIQGTGRIDLLGVSQGHQYAGDLLLAYITRLSPKYVIFRNGDKLDGWIDASLFAAQIATPERYPYDELTRRIRGIRTETVAKTASAREALEQMQQLHLDHLAVIDADHRFQFMLSRDDILSKVITAVVLARNTAN